MDAVLAGGFVLLSAMGASALILEEGFESGTHPFLTSGNPPQVITVADARNGSYVMKSQLTPSSPDPERTEASCRSGNPNIWNFDVDQEYWVGISIKLDSDHLDSGKRSIVERVGHVGPRGGTMGPRAESLCKRVALPLGRLLGGESTSPPPRSFCCEPVLHLTLACGAHGVDQVERRFEALHRGGMERSSSKSPCTTSVPSGTRSDRFSG